ncbi:MAG TPA: Mov34/MPN/PAD-1 family protein [Promineifilum sp.]
MTSASSSPRPAGGPALSPGNPSDPDDGPRVADHRSAISSLPYRKLPGNSEEWIRHGRAPGPEQPWVAIHQTAILQTVSHSRSHMGVELSGALLGHTFRNDDKVIVEIKAALPAISADHGPVHFTFSADSWSTLHKDRATHYPDLDIVGWFHTHPDLGVFYSTDDVVVHSAAFTLPWHVGLVVDPVRSEAAFFGWTGGEVGPLAGFFEVPERQPESQVPWKYVDATVGGAEFGLRPMADPGQVFLARNGRPRFSFRELGLLASGLALLLSFFLIVGVVLPLQRRVNLMETTILNLAQLSMTENNGLACPDPRLRILVPLVNQVYPVGSLVQLVGTADYPQAERYQVDARSVGGDRWSTVARFRRDIRLGQLAQWNTEQLPAGNYELRLIPVDSNNIKLAESAACTVPLTLTPASPG